MNQSVTRPHRNARPTLESLEERKLMARASSAAASSTDLSQVPGRGIARQLGISVQDRRIAYTTPQGTNVVITLYGIGSLKGSTVDPDGALNLVFSGTRGDSGIVGRVSGGTGRAPIRSMHHLALNPDDLSGIG